MYGGITFIQVRNIALLFSKTHLTFLWSSHIWGNSLSVYLISLLHQLGAQTSVVGVFPPHTTPS